MEVLVSLVELHNVALLDAGFYRLSLWFSEAESAALVSWSRTLEPRHSVRGRPLAVASAAELPQMTEHASSSFEVRYDDERVNLEEHALFSLPDDSPSPALLVKLEYAPVEAGQRKVEFKELDKKRVLLYGADNGISAMARVFFDNFESGTAILDLIIHAGTIKPPREDPMVLFPPDVDVSSVVTDVDKVVRQWSHHCVASLRTLAMLEQLASVLFLPVAHFEEAPSLQQSVLETSKVAPGEEESTATSSTEVAAAPVTVDALCKRLEAEGLQQAARRSVLWFSLLQNLPKAVEDRKEILLDEWMQLARDVVGELVIKETKPRSALSAVVDAAARGVEHARIAAALRAAPRFTEWSSSVPLSSEGLFADPAGRPVVFIERFAPPPPLGGDAVGSGAPKQQFEVKDKRGDVDKLSRGLHVIVFMHGFQGSTWDMRSLQLCMASLDLATVRPLIVSSAYMSTELDMRLVAGRVTHEILGHIDSLSRPVTRISFLCYSMGAVLIRLCLANPLMRKFDSCFYSFVSIAGPHLGSNSDSAVVGLGHWVLMKWKQIVSLEQLSLRDPEGLLVNLAQHDQLKLFEHVALISSFEDTYVASTSARVEVSPMSTPVQQQMQAALVKSLMNVKHLVKIDMAFEFTSGRTARERIDAILGRAAHVHLLDSKALILALLLTCGEEWFGD